MYLQVETERNWSRRGERRRFFCDHQSFVSPLSLNFPSKPCLWEQQIGGRCGLRCTQQRKYYYLNFAAVAALPDFCHCLSRCLRTRALWCFKGDTDGFPAVQPGFTELWRDVCRECGRLAEEINTVGWAEAMAGTRQNSSALLCSH